MTDDLAYEDEDDDTTEFDIEVDDDDQLAEVAEGLGEMPAPRRELSERSKRMLAYLKKRRLLDVHELVNMPPPVWFIEELIPLGSRMILVAEGGSYKSFLALDWMLSAAMGRAWMGRAMHPGKVLYMAGEGVRGLGWRVRAWCQRNEVTLEELAPHVTFLGEPFELYAMSEDGRDAWANLVAAGGFQYICIDTLHTASSGAEENSNTEMGKVLATATNIAGGPDGATCLYVHHKPKGATGARGASTLRDDFDVALLMDVKNKDKRIVELRPDKIRDADPFKPLYIRLDKAEDEGWNSLYVAAISHDKKFSDGVDDDSVEVEHRETAVDRAEEAIRYHNLLPTGWGAERIHEELQSLDLGYTFSRATVGRALRNMRGAEQEVKTLARRQETNGTSD